MLRNVGDFEAVHRVVHKRLRRGLALVQQPRAPYALAEPAVKVLHHKLRSQRAQVGAERLRLLLAVHAVADKSRDEF